MNHLFGVSKPFFLENKRSCFQKNKERKQATSFTTPKNNPKNSRKLPPQKITKKNPGWYYVAICSSFAFGSLIHRLCELKWPNKGGSTAARPLALLMLMGELAYVLTDCPLAGEVSNNWAWNNKPAGFLKKVLETWKT